jgi:hypothetical protein
MVHKYHRTHWDGVLLMMDDNYTLWRRSSISIVSSKTATRNTRYGYRHYGINQADNDQNGAEKSGILQLSGVITQNITTIIFGVISNVVFETKVVSCLHTIAKA